MFNRTAIAEFTLADIRYAAMGLLARREHSRKELQQKLLRRFADVDMVVSAVEALGGEGLQSDPRFAEAYVRACEAKGKGPIRIAMELRERGIADELVEACLDHADDRWERAAAEVRVRRFGEALPKEIATRAKQMRFLQYRGFNSGQISAAFKPGGK